MPWAIILTAIGCLALGFGAGIRYTRSALLPAIMARLSTEELHDVGLQAAEIRRQGQ